MNTESPWAPYKAPYEFPFHVYWENAHSLVVVMWINETDSFGCLGSQHPRSVELSTDSGRTSVAVEPYSLQLKPWTGDRQPTLLMHPFALAHLFATQQVARTDIESLVRHSKPTQISLGGPVTSDCPLLWVLRQPRCGLIFSTLYDIELWR